MQTLYTRFQEKVLQRGKIFAKDRERIFKENSGVSKCCGVSKCVVILNTHFDTNPGEFFFSWGISRELGNFLGIFLGIFWEFSGNFQAQGT